MRYNITELEYRKLDQIYEILLHKIFACSSPVTSETLSLELGLLPVRFIIKLRRVIYLQHIMKQRNSNSLLFSFLEAQRKFPKKNDWFSQVTKDLDNLEINIIQIETIPTKSLKVLAKPKFKK